MKKMHLFIKSAALLVAIATITGCHTPSLPTSKVKESGTTFAKDALMPYIKTGELPGAINVFYKDGLQETTCIGYADAAKKRPLTMDDVFMQCSQTKGFCGVTIAILVEEGKISLDDPVHKYLPEFKELWIEQSNKNGVKTLVKAKNTLTIRMVMNHTGGFRLKSVQKVHPTELAVGQRFLCGMWQR